MQKTFKQTYNSINLCGDCIRRDIMWFKNILSNNKVEEKYQDRINNLLESIVSLDEELEDTMGILAKELDGESTSWL